MASLVYGLYMVVSVYGLSRWSQCDGILYTPFCTPFCIPVLSFYHPSMLALSFYHPSMLATTGRFVRQRGRAPRLHRCDAGCRQLWGTATKANGRAYVNIVCAFVGLQRTRVAAKTRCMVLEIEHMESCVLAIRVMSGLGVCALSHRRGARRTRAGRCL